LLAVDLVAWLVVFPARVNRLAGVPEHLLKLVEHSQVIGGGWQVAVCAAGVGGVEASLDEVSVILLVEFVQRLG